MAYQLRNDEPIAGGLKRIAGEQLSAAIADLQSGKVYEVRKAMKRLRALLRLIKPELGPVYVEENRRLREVGQRFSAQRDAEVSLEVLEKFADQYKRKRTLDPHRRVLTSKRQVAEASQAAEELVGTLRRVDDWSLYGLTGDELERRVSRTHKQARRAFEHAKQAGTAEDFHEFRKLVKREFNQVKLLRPDDLLLVELKKLGDYLGDHHNLVVLLSNVGQTSRRFGLMVKREERRLEHEAVALGERLYHRGFSPPEIVSPLVHQAQERHSALPGRPE